MPRDEFLIVALKARLRCTSLDWIPSRSASLSGSVPKSICHPHSIPTPREPMESSLQAWPSCPPASEFQPRSVVDSTAANVTEVLVADNGKFEAHLCCECLQHEFFALSEVSATEDLMQDSSDEEVSRPAAEHLRS